jgi:hypothetical protein
VNEEGGDSSGGGESSTTLSDGWMGVKKEEGPQGQGIV